MTTPPPTPALIPVTLEKVCNGPLDNLTLFEFTPAERIEALLASGKLQEHWDDDNYQHKMSKQLYANEAEQLKAYQAITKQNVAKIQYKKQRHGLGRPIPVKSLGYTALRKQVRNTLLKDILTDFDLKNAQPELANNLCRIHGIHAPLTTELCFKRDDKIKEVCDLYGVNRHSAKNLFIRLFFFGSIQKWAKKHARMPTRTSFIRLRWLYREN